MKSLSWPAAFLIAFVSSVILAACVFLIHTDKASPTLLLAPLGAILTGAASGAVFYMRGLIQMPPGLEDAMIETRIVKTIPPPPTADDLLGGQVPPVVRADEMGVLHSEAYDPHERR